MERRCKACKELKSIDEFPEYVAKGKRGYRYTCKVCWQERWGPVWKEHINRYYDTNHAGIRDRAKERSLQAYQRNKHNFYRHNEIYKEKHPERHKAQAAVASAVRSGKLIRQPCEVCGNLKTDAHHEDYGKPLEVRWLCRSHHGERQRQINRKKAG